MSKIYVIYVSDCGSLCDFSRKLTNFTVLWPISRIVAAGAVFYCVASWVELVLGTYKLLLLETASKTHTLRTCNA